MFDPDDGGENVGPKAAGDGLRRGRRRSAGHVFVPCTGYSTWATELVVPQEFGVLTVLSGSCTHCPSTMNLYW